MRAAIIAALAFVALGNIASAQNGPVVEIPFNPAENSTWAVTEVRTRTKTGEPPQTSRTEATLVIGAWEDDRFAARWTSERVAANGDRTRDSAEQPAFMTGVPIDFYVDAMGVPAGFRDWPAIRSALLENIGETLSDPDAVGFAESMLAGWDNKLASQMLLPAIGALSLCHGVALRIGEPAQGEVMVANALGGAPILANETLTLTHVDEAAHTATIIYTRRLDPASATAAIVEGVERMARESGGDPAQAEATLGGHTLTQDIRAECTVDMQTGVTLSLDYAMRVTVAGSEAGEMRQITVQPRR